MPCMPYGLQGIFVFTPLKKYMAQHLASNKALLAHAFYWRLC